MGNVNDRDFSFRFAAMRAQKFLPKGKRREVQDFGVFEQQLALSGYRIVEGERSAQALPSYGD